MPTLVFCTAYAPTLSVWETRYRMWLAAAETLAADQILLVDDGSPVLPGWPKLQVASGDVAGEAFTLRAPGPAFLFHFRNRLGRADTLDFPGWHRSFAFAALYAEARGFDRVIHLESDAFLLSERARHFVASFTDGWAAFYAPQFSMPEAAIQVAAGAGVRALAAFARQPYAALVGRAHELAMPFTHVERGLAGRRVDETAGAVPSTLDFAAQVPSRRERGFYWWLPGHAPPPPPAHSLRLQFCAGGDGIGALSEGWADPEPRHHWMLGGDSVLSLPDLRGQGAAVLRLGVTPHLGGDLTRQRLALEINGLRLREYDIFLESVLGCDIPTAALHAGRPNQLRLIHPDAAAPSALTPGVDDTRLLSVSVEWLEFER